MVLRSLLFFITITWTLSVEANDPPKFLVGFWYRAELTVTDDGVPFVYYIVEGDDFRPFLKSISKNQIVGLNIEKNGLVWVDRKVDGWVVSVANGLRYRQALVVCDC
jgi:hypothetical protein